jgi:hypothetical protein
MFNMLNVGSVFGFGVVNPCTADGDWKLQKFGELIFKAKA